MAGINKPKPPNAPWADWDTCYERTGGNPPAYIMWTKSIDVKTGRTVISHQYIDEDTFYAKNPNLKKNG